MVNCIEMMELQHQHCPNKVRSSKQILICETYSLLIPALHECAQTCSSSAQLHPLIYHDWDQSSASSSEQRGYIVYL